jgi:hypothetical protein
MPSLVRVTRGIAIYNRESYLADAICSGLSQDFSDLQALVAVDGSINPKVNELPAASPVGLL